MNLRVAWLAALAGVASCSGKPEIGIDVSLAKAADAAWIEVGVYDGACVDPHQLGGGLPASGALTRVAFRYGTQSPALGTLKRGKYAFAGVARRADCAVVAAGCTNLDADSSSTVSLSLSPLEEPAGACALGAVCDSGRCVPGLDNADPSVGAACSLQLVGAGPLTNPLAAGSTLVSAPAITAAGDGFLLAYREYAGDKVKLA